MGNPVINSECPAFKQCCGHDVCRLVYIDVVCKQQFKVLRSNVP